MTFDAQERETLRELADRMIPAGAGLPSAADAGVHTGLLDKTVKVRPDLAQPLRAALAAVAGLDPDEAWAHVHSSPDLLDVVGLVVAGAYLMSADVAGELGYPFQEAKIVDPDDVARAIDEGLLDDVVERGPIYRIPPDAPGHHGP
ncbi:MAG: hypothetical protein ABW215_10560 [Kibdelosporangium sp.]